MTYSSGMPVLYPVGALNFTIIYWVYKVLMIKHYQKTTSFNQDMPKLTINFYRLGVIFHLLVGAFMFTNSNILSPANLDLINALEDQLDTLVGLEKNHFFTRFANSIGLLYILFFALVVFLISLRKIGW